MEEEIQKQESIMSAAGVDSRTKRRCVIMREQMSKKKEWWEEEGLGSESEDDNERDIGKNKQTYKRKVSSFVYMKGFMVDFFVDVLWPTLHIDTTQRSVFKTLRFDHPTALSVKT